MVKQTDVDDAWPWACPACGSTLTRTGDAEMRCPVEDRVYRRVDGIWRFLTPSQASHYDRFIRNYDVVREAEQWGSDQADYYRALPYRDLSGRHTRIWRLRAISYDALLEKVLRPLSASQDRPLRIIDAGTGNCWLANRLAQEGHQVLATDLRTNASDGLGAHVWYADTTPFVPVQATFETIPLAANSVDLVVYAGAFHYATDYETTLQEAMRVLQPEGQIVIMETPVYGHARSGEQMVQELHARLHKDHGVNADALQHENYLTLQQVRALGHRLGLKWRVIEPHYGWRWALAPWLARLRRRREPARFYLMVAAAKE